MRSRSTPPSPAPPVPPAPDGSAARRAGGGARAARGAPRGTGRGAAQAAPDPESPPPPPAVPPEELYRREKARRMAGLDADLMAEAKQLFAAMVAETGARRGRPVSVGASAGRPRKVRPKGDEFDLPEYRPDGDPGGTPWGVEE